MSIVWPRCTDDCSTLQAMLADVLHIKRKLAKEQAMTSHARVTVDGTRSHVSVLFLAVFLVA